MSVCTALSIGTIGAAILAGALWTAIATFLGFMAGQALGWIKSHDQRFSDGDDA